MIIAGAVVYVLLFIALGFMVRARLTDMRSTKLLMQQITDERNAHLANVTAYQAAGNMWEGKVEQIREQLKSRDKDLAHFVHSHNYAIKGREAPHAGEPKLDVQCGCGARAFVTEDMWNRLFGGESPS